MPLISQLGKPVIGTLLWYAGCGHAKLFLSASHLTDPKGSGECCSFWISCMVRERMGLSTLQTATNSHFISPFKTLVMNWSPPWFQGKRAALWGCDLAGFAPIPGNVTEENGQAWELDLARDRDKLWRPWWFGVLTKWQINSRGLNPGSEEFVMVLFPLLYHHIQFTCTGFIISHVTAIWMLLFFREQKE